MLDNSPKSALADPDERLSSRILFAACERALRRLRRGSVEVILPSDSRRVFGGVAGGVQASIRLNNFRVFWKSLRRGTVGFADSYIDGDFDTPNLANLFRFFLDNKSNLKEAGRGWFRVRRGERRFHARRANSVHGARRNIAAHYDLGNDFYRLWLDESMTYSSALFTAPDQPLADAQRAKYERVIAMLEGSAQGHLLEIGCGWGGFAEVAGAHGARVDAITISQAQLEYAQERLAAAGLGDRCWAEHRDYRHTQGEYDGIVSIEMIEAVGEEHWPDYFQVIYDRLKRGGHAVLQSITIAEDFFETYRRQVDFIQRYIFPGGMLPSPAVIGREARRAGLELSDVHTFGESYARTLWLWRENFHANWPAIRALGFDERFKRLWDYYLTYCAVGFERGTIDVGLYRLTKPA
jgi:cyclopropane-fatty-acyl-phospholipid synthase